MIFRIGRIGVLAALMLALVSCERDAVPAGDIEREIKNLVMQSDGRPAQSVDCPQPLPAKAGSSIRCRVTIGDGQTYGVTVKLRSVEGERADYDIEIDDAPST